MILNTYFWYNSIFFESSCDSSSRRSSHHSFWTLQPNFSRFSFCPWEQYIFLVGHLGVDFRQSEHIFVVVEPVLTKFQLIHFIGDKEVYTLDRFNSFHWGQGSLYVRPIKDFKNQFTLRPILSHSYNSVFFLIFIKLRTFIFSFKPF